MILANTPETPVLVGDLREPQRARPADPFQALDELMVVLEALCPRWPTRPPTTDTADMRL
jgi:hypothetical protein